jgi:uncharacterized membrane protein YidH (DUF202 family)
MPMQKASSWNKLKEETIMLNLVQNVACDIDFNDSEAYQGSSFLPFIGFMCFVLGIVLIFIGIVKIVSAKHQWNLFFDQRDRKDLDAPVVRRDGKIGIVLTVIGVVVLIGSFFM